MTMCVPSYIFLMLAAFVTGMQPNGHLNSYLNLMNFSPDGVTQKDFPRFPHRFGVKSPAETSTQIRNKYEDMLRNRRAASGVAEIKPDSMSEEEAIPEVRWADRGHCADPYNRHFRVDVNEEIHFMCNMLVPQGSKIEWYKGSELKRLYYYGSLTTGLSFGRPRIIEKQPEYAAEAAIQSNFYKDSASVEDEGEYMIRVETPRRRTYDRNFTLTVSGTSLQPYYPICEVKIEEFAKAARGVEGGQMVLPCSSQGKVVRKWYAGGSCAPISNSDKFRVEMNGNLVINKLSKSDTIFRCLSFKPDYCCNGFDEKVTKVMVL